ncbi:hypothetical protein V7S43_008857 [Phytophthora oleae]|uniref:Peptidase C1A papain C-terminal domain-containing protein n=1 Tax=Phytophthora oleae TaxID=2107226 RepID=A0ABD3FI08_9STRA
MQTYTSVSALRFIEMAAIAAVAVSSVDGRQMHAGIDYHRYLAERNETRQELEDWKANFGDMAKNNGWMPPSSGNSEERSADDDEEDHLQRFYMTKQNISAIQALNPNANFSTNTPFTLLTNEEFKAYVGNAYRSHNGSSVSSSSTSRRLRSWHRSSSTKTAYSNGTPVTVSKTTSSTKSGSPQTSVLSGTNYESTSVKTVTSTGADGKSSTVTTTTTSSGPGTESTTVTTSSGSGANTASNFGFGSGMSSLWQQWGNGFNFGGWGQNNYQPETVKPAGSDATSTTYAPTTPTPTTAAPTTSAPTTAAPTTTPVPTTATPSTTSSTKTVTATDTSATSSSSEVDWTDSNCVSPIQNQGSCGDCWAFSTAAAIESGQCINGGQKTLNKYSEQQLTSCDSQNYGCNGGAPVYAMEYVQQNGLCTEADYPYTSSDGTAASCSTGCSAVDTGITGYESVDDASSLLTAVTKQPVIVAVASGNNAWKQYTGGVISSCDTSELDHAVVVVGYTDSEWKIRNSWGDSWGEEGYIRLERTSDSTGTCGMYGDMSYPTF